MTLLSLLSSNATDRFEGCVALSAYVPLLDHLDDVRSLSPFFTVHSTDCYMLSLQIVTPESKDIPLFWGHGQLDPYLTLASLFFSAPRLYADKFQECNSIDEAKEGAKLLNSFRIGLRKFEFHVSP